MYISDFETRVSLPDGTSLFCKIFNSNMEPKVLKKETTIIVLHGGPGMDHTLLVPFWKQLATTFQIILPDLRGCGRSDKSTTSQWNLTSWSKDIEMLIAKLDLNTKPFLAGSSFGGYVALKFATSCSNSISGLILCDTEARMDKGRFLQRLKNKVIALGQKSNVDTVLNAAEAFFNDPTPQALGEYVQHCLPYYQTNPRLELDMSELIFSPEVLRHFNRHELFSFNLLPQLKNVSIPVLYLTSGINPYHAIENAYETVSAMVNAQIEQHVFEKTGSEVCFHEPEKCKELIENFVVRYK